MSRILVTGSETGLGREIVTALKRKEHGVAGFDHNLYPRDDVRNPPPTEEFWNRYPCGIDVLINCAGVNDIGPLEDFTEARWDRVMNTNAKGIYMMTRALLPLLLEGSPHPIIVNIISNASHMPMTHSLAYNASKGAAHIMTQQLAREFKGRLCVFGISPNKLEGTGMSNYIDDVVPDLRGWSPEEAKQYQLNSLLAGVETPPKAVAEFLAYLLDSYEHYRYLTGCIIPYGA